MASGAVKKGLLVVAGVVVVAAAGVFAVLDHVGRRVPAQRISEYVASAEQNVERFCSEQQALAREPFFQSIGTAQDAASFLNPKLPWDGVESGAAPLALAGPIRSQLKSHGRDWLAKGLAAPAASLDFGWMAQLSGYDHWSLIDGGPLSGRAEIDPVTAPLPDFTTVHDWARLRLIEGVRAGTPEVAAAEVRHLAALAYSTNTVVGQRVAGAILSHERTAFDHVAATGAAPEAWTPMSAEALERFKQVTRAAGLFRLAVLPAALSEKVLSCSAATRCRMLSEESAFAAMIYALHGEDDGGPLSDLRRRALAPGPRCDTRLSQAAYRHYLGDTEGSVDRDAVDASLGRLYNPKGAVQELWSTTGSSYVGRVVANAMLAESLPSASSFEQAFAADSGN